MWWRCAYLAHGTKHRQAEVQGAGLLGVDTPDHVRAVLDGLLAVEGARLAREALADHLSMLEDGRRRRLGLRGSGRRGACSAPAEVAACVLAVPRTDICLENCRSACAPWLLAASMLRL